MKNTATSIARAAARACPRVLRQALLVRQHSLAPAVSALSWLLLNLLPLLPFLSPFLLCLLTRQSRAKAELRPMERAVRRMEERPAVTGHKEAVAPCMVTAAARKSKDPK